VGNTHSGIVTLVTLFPLSRHPVEAKALIDTGASISFASKQFLARADIQPTRKEIPKAVYMADGTLSLDGLVGHHLLDVPLSIYGFHDVMNFDVLSLAEYDLIIGADWLQRHDAVISWKDKSLAFPNQPSVPSTVKKMKSLINDSSLYASVLQPIDSPVVSANKAVTVHCCR
jgi:hypothetical protein